jgi:RNA polymerase-binding transcription factor DksA
MTQQKTDRKALERRRGEILQQLGRVNDELQVELDRDPEEQAIQLEHDEVSISMEDNLRRELAEIEDQLAQLDQD